LQVSNKGEKSVLFFESRSKLPLWNRKLTSFLSSGCEGATGRTEGRPRRAAAAAATAMVVLAKGVTEIRARGGASAQVVRERERRREAAASGECERGWRE
jgi:hypothetical protein